MNKQLKVKNGTVKSRGIEWLGDIYHYNPSHVKAYSWTRPDGEVVWLADNGFTSNPIAGCHYGCEWVMPDGSVAKCYAKRVSNAFGMYPQGFEPTGDGGEKTVYTKESEMKGWESKTPSHIFVGSQADVFAKWSPAPFVAKMLRSMAANPQHRYYTLTKAPHHLWKFDHLFGSHNWVGASVAPSIMQGHQLSEKAREIFFMRTLNALSTLENPGVKWLSLEPLAWDVAPTLQRWLESGHAKGEGLKAAVDWIVIGAASNGPKNYLPRSEWVGGVLEIAHDHNIPVFFKGNMAGWGVGWYESKPRQNLIEVS